MNSRGWDIKLLSPGQEYGRNRSCASSARMSDALLGLELPRGTSDRSAGGHNCTFNTLNSVLREGKSISVLKLGPSLPFQPSSTAPEGKETGQACTGHGRDPQ